MTNFILTNNPNTLEKFESALKNISERGHTNGDTYSNWELTIADLHHSKSEKNNITWRNISKFGRIKKNQCLFLLMDLPTSFLGDRPDFIKSIEHDSINSNNPIARIVTESLEFSSLKQSDLEFSGMNTTSFYVWEYDTDTKVFIDWAMKADFIEGIDTQDDVPTANKNRANQYSTWQKYHNLVVVLVATKNYGDNKELSRILKDEKTPFYKSIQDNLAPLHEGGIKKPTAKTLRNSLSQHNAFPEKLKSK